MSDRVSVMERVNVCRVESLSMCAILFASTCTHVFALVEGACVHCAEKGMFTWPCDVFCMVAYIRSLW